MSAKNTKLMDADANPLVKQTNNRVYTYTCYY